MIKTVIIIILLYLFGSLLYGNKPNVDILVDDFKSKKEFVKKGASYVKSKLSKPEITNMTETLNNLKEFGTEELTDETSSK